MSNVINLKFTATEFTCAEATPDGINLYRRNADGQPEHIKLAGWKTVIRWLDNGSYDSHLTGGLRLVAALWEGESRSYITLSDEQKAFLWRWIIACLFIHEQQETNGTTDITNEEGGTDRAVIYCGKHGGMAVYPSTERVSLANHVEGIAIEKYGREAGLQRAIQLYQGMAEAATDGSPLRLSAWGREVLTDLHDDFIQMLHSEGLPAEPVMH